MRTQTKGTRVRCKHCQQKTVLNKAESSMLRLNLSAQVRCELCNKEFRAELLPAKPQQRLSLPPLPDEVSIKTPEFLPLILERPEPHLQTQSIAKQINTTELPPFGQIEDENAGGFLPMGFEQIHQQKPKSKMLQWVALGVIVFGLAGIFAWKTLKKPKVPELPVEVIPEPAPVPQASSPEPKLAVPEPKPKPVRNPFVDEESRP